MGLFKQLLNNLVTGSHSTNKHDRSSHHSYKNKHSYTYNLEPTRMQTCPFCNSGQAKGAQFCSQCGTNLSIANCSQCGNTFPPQAKFCSQCGQAK